MCGDLVGGEAAGGIRVPLVQDPSSWQECAIWRDGGEKLEGNGQTPDFRRACLQVTLGFGIDPKDGKVTIRALCSRET